MEISKKKNLSRLRKASILKPRNAGRWGGDDPKIIENEVRLMTFEELCQNYINHITKISYIYSLLNKYNRRLSRKISVFKIYCIRGEVLIRCSVYLNIDNLFLTIEYSHLPNVVVSQFDGKNDIVMYVKLANEVILNKLP